MTRNTLWFSSLFSLFSSFFCSSVAHPIPCSSSSTETLIYINNPNPNPNPSRRKWWRVLDFTPTSARGPKVCFFFFFFFISALTFFVFCNCFDFNCVDFFPLILDLLYKDYQSDHKFTLTTVTSAGVVSSLIQFVLIQAFSCFLYWKLLDLSKNNEW